MTAHGLETGVLTDVFLPISLAVIMFGMGLGLRTRDFRRLAGDPKGVLVGLSGQLILLPVLGIGVTYVFVRWAELSVPLALGVLVLAASPGGTTSNLLTFLSRGDHALSIVLTSVVSLASFLTTPAVLYVSTVVLFGNAQVAQVDFVRLTVLVLGIVGVPVVTGMIIGARKPELAKLADRPVRIAGALLLAVLIAGITYLNRDGFLELAKDTVPAALALNAVALAAGLALGWLAKLTEAERRCVAIEVGFQNGALGIVLAVSELGSPEAALMPGFYSLVMFATGGLLAGYWTRETPEDMPGRLDQEPGASTETDEPGEPTPTQGA